MSENIDDSTPRKMMANPTKLQAHQETLASQRYVKAGAWSKTRKAHQQIDLPKQQPRHLEKGNRYDVRISLLEERDGLAYERILGTTNLLSVNYLSQGQRASRSVCRIQIRNRSGRSKGFGTGFLVSPHLLLTNNHVISSRELALRSLAEFEFEDDDNFNPKDSVLFNLDQSQFFYTNVELDFTLVMVRPQSINRRRKLREFGFLSLVADSGKALIGESVSIIQHPDGADKKIAVRENRVLGVIDAFIHYETDTLPGSSGAPVLNDQWTTVAIHHAGVAEKNRNGSILAKNGRVWKPEMGEEQKHWIANEGIRISSIFSHLATQNHWQKTHRDLLQELGVHLETTTAPENNKIEEKKVQLSRISVDNFYEILIKDHVTEQDIRPYVQLDPKASGPFYPIFRLDPTKINSTSNDIKPLLTWATSWCRSITWRRYRQKISQHVIKVVSVGDSWFHYPFFLHSIIAHLMDRELLAIYNIGAEGDLLLEIMAKGEYIDAIERENPSYFLISGGGTDLFANGQLSRLLHPFDRQRKAEEYPNDIFNALLERIDLAFSGLFSLLTQRFPKLRILCHGYDYFKPNNDHWLGQPLTQNGIQDQKLQCEIVIVVMDRLNAMLESVAARYHLVTWLDLRGSVSSNEWVDELHPTSAAFGDLSTVFADILLKGT